ncbi:ABC transporter [Candidatus Roizmanbacteria bacterium CG2_30_33_16]|uniref:ABC transporter n=4 Tax=Candidatus Roizmaniibacteriota TaxID=1752723 RepID=A0A2H0C2W9_9BACT|nr:metal ABC transporter permease [Candidatus Roizmanbacteria bacterium]OIP85023.1 MAG: ABC transporter [Candidatus Roizmanbacteria bacterium CG2_30_33_16]PIP64265.1 MAG: ABC transporter [Candidatus Roizmanbacteria bacterium CG22_combo_CG10-13_8_21_14_all_33_16]PIX69511.1 MAG: ABC transporter [Candidatus Roizmanbacteria bacterium CG_4_10_14_3_um_filter_33_21]PJB89674.1 MAG: ABC transporter [Candidatus Roizmanbacteria bacterium CG_4_9_14_0_8_um_filter_34_12]
MEIFNILSYSFIQRAFIAGSFVAVTCSVLGLFLVLRKMSLIGDGLSHVSFGAIALGLFFGIYPFYVAIPIVMLASLLILKISEKAKVYGDAAIGIVSVIGIASGVILASVSKGFNVDLFSYLFGNILAISMIEVVLSVLLSVIVLTVVYFFYWDLFSITYDEEYAKVIGIKPTIINNVLTLLTAVTVVLSVKMVGIMLVSALLILPVVTALQFGNSFNKTLIVGSIVSLFSVLLGICFSFFLDIPTGATIVMANALFFCLALLYKKVAYVSKSVLL